MTLENTYTRVRTRMAQIRCAYVIVISSEIRRIERWIKESAGYKPVISNVELGQSRKRRRDMVATRYHWRNIWPETTTTFKRRYLVGPNTRSWSLRPPRLQRCNRNCIIARVNCSSYLWTSPLLLSVVSMLFGCSLCRVLCQTRRYAYRNRRLHCKQNRLALIAQLISSYLDSLCMCVCVCGCTIAPRR